MTFMTKFKTFKIICCECGSENVYAFGNHYLEVDLECRDCKNSEANSWEDEK
jgi:hypothetical protein